jgi:hypothetical protein
VDEVGQRGQLAAYGAQADMNRDRQRFELQAELHGVELSQAERIRLQRLKNSVGEVMADRTLTEEEKADYVSQIKYNIDPLQRRLAQEKLQQEKIVKESLVENRQAQAALRQQELKFATSTFEERKVYDVDPAVLSQIVADIRTNAPGGQTLPPQELDRMARQEAMRQGLGKAYYQKKAGEWEPMEDGGAGGSAGSGKKSAGADHPSGLSADQFVTEFDKVVQSVDKKIAERDQNGNPVSPQTPEWRMEAIQGDWQARLRTLEQYRSMGGEKKGGAKEYQSPYQKPATPAAAATPGVQARTPFKWNAPEKPEQKAAVKDLDDLRTQLRTVSTDGGRRDVAAAMTAYYDARRILEAAGPAGMNADERREFTEALGTIASVLKTEKASRQPPANPALAAAAAGGEARPWWQKVAAGDVGRETLDIPKQLGRLGIPGVGRQ